MPQQFGVLPFQVLFVVASFGCRPFHVIDDDPNDGVLVRLLDDPLNQEFVGQCGSVPRNFVLRLDLGLVYDRCV
jgi:hypothetical protein